MRKVFSVVLALAMIAAACGGDDAGGEAGAVSIDSPASGTQVATGTGLTIQVTASDDGGVARIDLQYDGQTILSITNSAGSNPFVAVDSYTPTSPGSGNLVAVAYRDDGSVVGSDQVALTVTGEAVTTTTAGDTTEDTTGETTDTTAGTTGTTAGTTGTTSGNTGTTAASTTSTSTSTSSTTTTAGQQQAEDDGGDGFAPPEYTLNVFAENSNPETATFEGEISNPGDRGDGIKIVVDNLFNGVNSDHALVTVQFICSPGGPRVKTVGTGSSYTGGSACDFTYTTTFDAYYQSYQKTYYIFVPDGTEGYFEYTLLVTALRD